jgi:hypothetical protein
MTIKLGVQSFYVVNPALKFGKQGVLCEGDIGFAEGFHHFHLSPTRVSGNALRPPRMSGFGIAFRSAGARNGVIEGKTRGHPSAS